MNWTLKVRLTPSVAQQDLDLQGIDILDDYMLVEDGDPSRYTIDLGFVDESELDRIVDEIHQALVDYLKPRRESWVRVEVDDRD